MVKKTRHHWLWMGCLSNKGYGRFHYGGGNQSVWAHRFSYEVFNGKLKKGDIVDHIRHAKRFRRCVRPACLEAVTMTENTRRGHGTKITFRVAQRIRAEYPKVRSLVKVAKKFRLARQTVWDIISGRRWKRIV